MTNKNKENEVKAFLGQGTEFDGKLMFGGSVRIDGDFKGEILGGGTLIVGESANIEANIVVDNLLVSGDVRGSIEIKKRVEIFSTGRLLGNVKTTTFVIQEGAVFEGDCQMVSEPEKESARKEDQ
ncbi:MAG: polymer-forming cytoskeletal protein [Thermodesulfobacteriota bacterium]|nr:polymer-forming cytoskeletal protein [Thermodesulfobacteriota bacterium]